jgi:hypothetical protein
MEKKEIDKEKQLRAHALPDIDKAIINYNAMLQGLLETIKKISDVSFEQTKDNKLIIIGMKNKERKIGFETQYNFIVTTIELLTNIRSQTWSLDPGFTILHIRNTLLTIREQWKKEINMDYLLIPEEIEPIDLRRIGNGLLQMVIDDIKKGDQDASVSLGSIHGICLGFIQDVKDGKVSFTGEIKEEVKPKIEVVKK